MFFHEAIQQNFVYSEGVFIGYPEGCRTTEFSFQNDFMISCLLTSYIFNII